MYDKLKFLAQIGLPAFGTLYFTIAQVWGLPGGANVVGTILAVDTFLGVLLGISTSAYNKSEKKYDGAIVVQEDPLEDKEIFSLELASHPDDLKKKKEVIFKIKP